MVSKKINHYFFFCTILVEVTWYFQKMWSLVRSNLIPAYFFAGNKILDLFCRSERQAEVVFTSQPQGSWRGVQGLPLPLPPSRLLQQIRGQGKVQVLHIERKAGGDQGHGESKGLQVCTGGCLVSTVQLYPDLGFLDLGHTLYFIIFPQPLPMICFFSGDGSFSILISNLC